MLYMLVDTCVWIDLARSLSGEQLIAAVRVLAHQGRIELLAPQLIIDEFEGNRERIRASMTRSLASDFRQVRATIELHGRARGRKAALSLIDDLSQRVPLMNQMATRFFDEIAELLNNGRRLKPTQDTYERVVQRALEKRAPFHHAKNGVADALLIEIYSDAVAAHAANEDEYCFVTANTKDFSQPNGDTRQPHPDLTSLFGDRSRFFTGIGAALLSHFPNEVDELLEELDFRDQPRSLDEIQPLLDMLWDQIWYNRHKNLEYKIEHGDVTLVDEWRGEDHESTVVSDVWERAKLAARRVEERWGLDDLGPWDDFEWGMISGKISALRWVLGEDWESSLDT